MSEHTVEKDAADWIEPPAHIYPHRYDRCAGCFRVVRDFQRDAVWRDRDGGTLCPANGWHSFHRVTPPG